MSLLPSLFLVDADKDPSFFSCPLLSSRSRGGGGRGVGRSPPSPMNNSLGRWGPGKKRGEARQRIGEGFFLRKRLAAVDALSRGVH